jgi:serine/threonine protein kinase
VKIIDFGTARGQNRRCHTVSGVVFAKPGYVAPEVANGNSGDARVDLYALGVMLWELCAGRRFLQGDASDHMAAVSRNERNLPPDRRRRRSASRARRYHRSPHRLRSRGALRTHEDRGAGSRLAARVIAAIERR